jgi:hypothetical protein
MEPRRATFRAENAINAQIFAWQVIWFCLHKPKEELSSLTSWCEQARDAVGEPPSEPPAWASGGESPPAAL